MLTMIEDYLGEKAAKDTVARISTNVVRYLSLPGFSTAGWDSSMDEYDIMVAVRKDLGNALEAAVAAGQCEHNWDGGVVAEKAGCITAGSTVYTCVDCGAQYDEVIPTLHSVGDCYKKVSGAAPTCTTDGSEIFECTLCGNKKTVTTTAFHNDADYYRYTQNSEKAHNVYCTVCDERLDAKAHTYFTIDTATCTEGGQLMDQCRYCGFETLPTDDNGNAYVSTTGAKGHNLVVERVGATCTADGYEGTVCKNCDYSEVTTIKAEGHTYVDGECNVCGDIDPNYNATPDVMKGDLDNNGEINSMDSNILKRIIASKITPTEIHLIAGDVDGDGEITSLDSNYLARMLTGKIK